MLTWEWVLARDTTVNVRNIILFKDIVSLRVEVGHISVPCPKVIDWFTVAVEEGGFGRHD